MSVGSGTQSTGSGPPCWASQPRVSQVAGPLNCSTVINVLPCSAVEHAVVSASSVAKQTAAPRLQVFWVLSAGDIQLPLEVRFAVIRVWSGKSTVCVDFPLQTRGVSVG